MKLFHVCNSFERRLFFGINRHFDKKRLNYFFRTITQLGSAVFTILSTLTLMIISKGQMRAAAEASALALACSHIPVFLLKKLFPRKRPYLVLQSTKFPTNPLNDHSFPSGHTTAFFSVIIPLILLHPSMTLFLLPLGLCVGTSRIYLGLHYPSDVLAGGILGSAFGTLFFHFMGLQ